MDVRLRPFSVPATLRSMNRPPVRRRLVFQGRVQGVGFRATARQIADRYPLTGWVRNDPDGTVVVEAQGAPAEIELFVIDLSERMSGFITTHSMSEIPMVDDEQGFEIIV